MGVDNQGGNFFDNGRHVHFAGSEVFDGIKKRKAVFIQACFDAVINDIENFFVRLEVYLSD